MVNLVVLCVEREATVLRKLKEQLGCALKENALDITQIEASKIELGSRDGYDDVSPLVEEAWQTPQQLAEQNQALKRMTVSLKQQVEALRVAQENYRRILDAHSEGIYQFTPDDRYVWVNLATSRIFGYDSSDAMVGSLKAITEVFVEPGKHAQFKQLLAENNEVKFQYQAYRQDGQKIWVEENTWAVRDCNGNILYYQSLVRRSSDRQQQAAPEPPIVTTVEIDRSRQAREVANIVQADSFRAMKRKLAEMKSRA
ncbi:MAG: PAS domain S-box protein [Cyanophyceae cyanobacterium]